MGIDGILLDLWKHQKIDLAKELSIYLSQITNEATGNHGLNFGDFLLVSGRRSPYYIDLRTSYSYPKVLDKLTESLAMMIEYEILGCPILSEIGKGTSTVNKIDKLAGVPNAGLGLTQLLSKRLLIPWFYCKEKGYGAGGIHGSLTKGESVILVDDLITTAKTKIQNANIISEAGGKVEHIIVVVDREEGGKEELEKMGIQLHSLIKMTELIQYLRDFRIIDDNESVKVMEYIKNKKQNMKG